MARPDPRVCSQKCGKGCPGARASTTTFSGADCARDQAAKKVNPSRTPRTKRDRFQEILYGKISGFASDPLAESGLIYTVTFAGSTENWLRSFKLANATGFRLKTTF